MLGSSKPDQESVPKMSIPKEVAGRFTVGSKIEDRSNAKIFEASDRQNGDRPVVLKFYEDQVHGNQEWINQFQQEVAQLQAIQHPSLVKILAGGEAEGYLYIAMERADGKTLRDILKEQAGPLPKETTLAVAKQLCGALEEFRKADAYHGHIDSRAVLVDGDSIKLAGFYPKVIESIRSEVTAPGGFIVDPAYIAPEQASGSSAPDYRVDIYAISVLLYELLTGEKPFRAANGFQTAMLRLTVQPPSPAKKNPEVGALLDAAVVKGLSRDANGRFDSFAEMLDALMAGQSSRSPETGSESPGGTPNKVTDTIPVGAKPAPIATKTVGVSMPIDHVRRMLAEKDEGGGTEQTGATSPAATPPPPAVDPKPTAAPERVADDVDETVTGVLDAEELKAALIVLEGSRRGERFSLKQEQTMIGSAAGCQIVLEGERVKSRSALIIRKRGEYYVTPLSDEDILCNGELVEDGIERQLQRGDVIRIGEFNLRFVAPGEVFSLKDNVADRVVDRAPDKVTSSVKIITGAVAALCLVVFFLFQQGFSSKEASEKKRQAAAAAKRKEVIAQLRAEGDAFLKEGKLIEPVGANARVRFDQILEIDPSDSYAKRRIAEIKERTKALRERRRKLAQNAQRIEKLLADADGFFQNGAYVSPPGANAKESYEEVLRIDPSNATALERMEKIKEMLGEMVGQINTLLTRAEEYWKKGHVISPEGENAFEMIKEVLRLNPGNLEANDMLLNMASQLIYQGDEAKKRANPKAMKKAYLEAQVLGVNPDFLEPRLRGVELMKKSQGSVFIYDGKEDGKEAKIDDGDGRYLDSTEIERRVARWKLQAEVQGATNEKKFFDLR